MPEGLLPGGAEILAALFHVVTEFSVFAAICKAAVMDIAVIPARVGFGLAGLGPGACTELRFGNSCAGKDRKQHQKGEKGIFEHGETRDSDLLSV